MSSEVTTSRTNSLRSLRQESGPDHSKSDSSISSDDTGSSQPSSSASSTSKSASTTRSSAAAATNTARLNRKAAPRLTPETIQECNQRPPSPNTYTAIPQSRMASSSATNGTASSEGSGSARPGVAPLFTDSPNARSKTITTASGPYTHGMLNQHACTPYGYSIGISEDTGARRVMEDAHAFVVDYAGVRGQGYFGVFDGHAGKHAAEWCGSHFHELLLEQLAKAARSPPPPAAAGAPRKSSIPGILNKTFLAADAELVKLSAANGGQGSHSGCTVVTALIRLEDDNAHQPPEYLLNAIEAAKNQSAAEPQVTSPIGSSSSLSNSTKEDRSASADSNHVSRATKIGRGVKSVVRSLTHHHHNNSTSSSNGKSGSSSSMSIPMSASPSSTMISSQSDLAVPVNDESVLSPGSSANAASFPSHTRRVLYTANAGDARAVLARSGNAIRLTYDHKGSDPAETTRIKNAGGFVMNNRVNGVLAVTRALGDAGMKEFVRGEPYVSEVTLGREDEWLIIACDGLWDVISDQDAVNLVHATSPITTPGSGDPQAVADRLVKYALENFSTDNISVLVVRLYDMESGRASASASASETEEDEPTPSVGVKGLSVGSAAAGGAPAVANPHTATSSTSAASLGNADLTPTLVNGSGH